jgi:thiamine-phosphate pyrophosphorylase
VTDRKTLAGTADEQIRLLLKKIEEVARAGVDCIQIRERDLPGRFLTEFVHEAMRRVPVTCRILVNDRLDIACTTGAAGVHLGEQSLPVAEAKRFLCLQNRAGNFMVGASTHSREAAVAAEQAGADYVIFGPVFATPSKMQYGEPQGVERLREICRMMRKPVLAIGAITVENAQQCVAAGVAGIAAIRLFQDAPDLRGLLSALRTNH